MSASSSQAGRAGTSGNGSGSCGSGSGSARADRERDLLLDAPVRPTWREGSMWQEDKEAGVCLSDEYIMRGNSPELRALGEERRSMSTACHNP